VLVTVPNPVIGWLIGSGSRILIILIALVVAVVVLRRIIPLSMRRALVRATDTDARLEQIKRAETLSGVLLTTSLIVLFALGIILLMAELGFSIGPIIAGIGITSIALGLGAQTLVKDTINGIFILAEDQFRRGDVVTIAGATGTVEGVGLRRTVLRHEDGTVFSVPNSAIGVSANYTRGYSGISFNIGLSFTADVESTAAEIDRIGEELARDPEYRGLILTPPVALRVDSLEDTYLNLNVSGRVAPRPGAQAKVASEMRRRIKQDFDRLGIPYRGRPIADHA
jgi:small conductance mechanosensitive channel